MLSLSEIKNLPKVELHRHLEGSIRFSTLQQYAAHFYPTDISKTNDAKTLNNRNSKTDLDQLRKIAIIDKPMTDLASVLASFEIWQKLLYNYEIIEQISFEACEDAYLDGVRILELRYAPTFIQEAHPKLELEKIHAAIAKGIKTAQQKYPILVGVIGIFVGTQSIEQAQKTLDLVLKHQADFIGIDIADNEPAYNRKNFSKLFDIARQNHLSITAHAGEAIFPHSIQNIIDSVEILGAKRIGHGLQIYTNTKAIDFLKQNNILLELCPYSNWLTNACTSHKEHPFAKLYNAGLAVSINSDDPGLFGSELSFDYQLLQEHQNLKLTDFQKINQMAYTHSFIAENKKQRFKSLFFEST